MPLLVDEAHGSHFGTHPGLPESAVRLGADCVMHSTHKVLSAMTQGAMLHIRGPRVDPVRVTRALQVLQVRHANLVLFGQKAYRYPESPDFRPLNFLTIQTSSPSYILMASLDAARAAITETGFMDAPLAAAEVRLDLEWSFSVSLIF